MRIRDRKTRRRSIGDAKARFAECVREAESGVTTVLTRHGRPVARLEPYAAPTRRTDGEIREKVEPYVAEQEAFSSLASRRAELRKLLEEIRAVVPRELRGKALSKREREELLGYGEGGV